MPRLQSLGTKLKQLNHHELTSPLTSTHLGDEQTRWETVLARLLSIKPPRRHDMTLPGPSSSHPATLTTLPVTDPTTGTKSAPAQPLDWPFPTPRIPPAPPTTPQPDSLTHYPSSIPKITHGTWLAHMPCPVAFSPCSPRATWPWPSWVCDAFEAGDVLWCTLGRGAKAGVERMGDGKQGPEKIEELRQLLETAKAKAQFDVLVQLNNKVAQRGDVAKKLEKGVLQQLEAMQLDAEKLRVSMQGQWNDTGKEGDEDWEVLDGVFDEEGWIDISIERKIGAGWAMVRRTVPSVGEDGGDGA